SSHPSFFFAHSSMILPPLCAVGKGRIAFVVRYATLSTSTPGKGLPSSHSRKAPPAVETYVNRPVAPAALSAATVSPPPATVTIFPAAVSSPRRLPHLDPGGVKKFQLRGAGRPVPDQRLDPGEHGADTLDAARADVQDHLIVTHASHRDHARGRVRRERFGNHGVDRQYELAAFGLRLGHDLARGRQEIALAQRF